MEVKKEDAFLFLSQILTYNADGIASGKEVRNFVDCFSHKTLFQFGYHIILQAKIAKEQNHNNGDGVVRDRSGNDVDVNISE